MESVVVAHVIGPQCWTAFWLGNLLQSNREKASRVRKHVHQLGAWLIPEQPDLADACPAYVKGEELIAAYVPRLTAFALKNFLTCCFC